MIIVEEKNHNVIGVVICFNI